jgi:DNA-binding NtrC family response regulator
MDRQRVLVLENDAPLEGVLRDLFGDEGLDVTACKSLTELQAGIQQYPRAAVVSDSWAQGDYLSLSPKHHAEIMALGRSAHVILTTGRDWAKHISEGELGSVEIIEKPYDLARLLAAVRVALQRASILGRSGPSVAATHRGRVEQPH